MKNAPNLVRQPKDKNTEVVIFVGTDALAHAEHWIAVDGPASGNDVPPVYVNDYYLDNLDITRIVDDGRLTVSIYKAGNVSELNINRVLEKLAIAGVREAFLYAYTGDQKPENVTPYLNRLRDQISNGEQTVVQMMVPEHDGAVLSTTTPINASSWPDKDDKGKPLETRENVEHMMRQYGITARYNEMRKLVEVNIPNFRATIDNQDNSSLDEMCSIAARNQLPRLGLQGSIRTIADHNAYNPVKDWILSLPWDGVPRIQQLLNTVHVKSGYPVEMRDTLIYRWLLSCVAAVFKPFGFHSRGVLVLVGDQLVGKTSWVKSLVPAEMDMVLDGAILDLGNKDSVTEVVGHWIVELGELNGTFKKTDTDSLKAFVGKEKDLLRRPYDRLHSRYPRHTIFFGSVNNAQYLIDPTGNTRFWTVDVESVDYDHGIDMQQVWAELLTHYDAGEQWWLTDDENASLNALNDDFNVVDTIEERLKSTLDWNAPVNEWRWLTATAILRQTGIDRPTQSEATMAGNTMKKMNGGMSKRTHEGKLLFTPPLIPYHDIMHGKKF